MVSIPPSEPYTCILETPQGLLLRVPVLRIDGSEALVDTDAKIPDQDGFEVIIERPDGHAEVLHTTVRTGVGGLTLRWDFRHPSEMTAIDRLLSADTSAWGGRDVPLDIESALVQRTRMVKTSQIAKQRDSIRVLKLDTVQELIAMAVDEALSNSRDRVDDAEREKILEESEARFQELLAQAKAEKEDSDAARRRVEHQLDRAREQLDREKAREIGSTRFTLSDEGIDTIERRLGDYLERAISRGETDEKLELELRQTIEGILDSERDKISALAKEASNDRIDLLEQKINRLSRSLSETEKERDSARQRAQALATSGGTLPAQNVVQPGLADADPQRGQKLALLADLVRENHDLRRRMEESGRGVKRAQAPSDSASSDRG